MAKNNIEHLIFSNTQYDHIQMDETGQLAFKSYKGIEFTSRIPEGSKSSFKDAEIVYAGVIDEKKIIFSFPGGFPRFIGYPIKMDSSQPHCDIYYDGSHFYSQSK